ncbi:RNA polymerase sigma factor [Alteromonas sediminis]|uniref:RNA polymerase sigma factor n=1 Tax=Alteromonas sediminis TaxID=2259342 RepID=A0A3N5Y094_9ALTE|nr:RNA polymerase sigma factor [Alteromonas sediminis]RPJ66460.1 RNA polymerase sigma factor [Alteromonas sediminis]
MKGQKFKQVLAEQQQRIYSLALYILHDPHDAEDSTQEVFTRLWNCMDDIEAEKVSGWLSAVTRNVCIDKIRRRRNTSEVQEAHQVTQHFEEPDGQLQHAQLSSWLGQAISGLKEPYGSLIMLCDVQQNSHSAAAASLNLSATQVKVYLHRARHQLKRLLKEFSHE